MRTRNRRSDARGDGTWEYPRTRRPSTREDAYARQDGSRTRKHRAGEPSVGELFRELTMQAQTLVRLEVRLAKTELGEKIDSYARNTGLLIGGGLIAYAGIIGIMMALGFLLASFMPAWLGFLCVGVLIAGIGYATLQAGLRGVQRTQVSLEKTAESIEEDREWIRKEASDVGKDPAHLGSHR